MLLRVLIVLSVSSVLCLVLCALAGGVADTASAAAGLRSSGDTERAHSGAELPVFGDDPGRAAAYFDSLSRAWPDDPLPAYWRARSLDLLGDRHVAFCGYLRLEVLASRDRIGIMAASRRLSLERRWADALLYEGRPATFRSPPEAGPMLLLPPDNLGPPEDELFAIVWNYLLFDALRQAGVCVLPVSVTMAAQEVLAAGGAVRVPLPVGTQPVNTVEGLRGHLNLLTGLDGGPYLAQREGGWDEDLQGALIRFQQELGIPPTGQADVVTQRRLQAALETWLLRLPPPLDPRDVPAIAAWLGAGTIVRGTYQADRGGYTLRLGLLDSSGAAVTEDPVLISIDPGTAGAAAVATARLLASALGLACTDGAVNSPAPEDFDAVTASLLLLDRGMPHLAHERWSRAPAAWFSWRLLADMRRAGGVRGSQIEEWEERMRRDWGRRPSLDREAAFDRMLSGLGRPGPSGGPLAWPDPGPGRVLGSEGILHIRGEIP